TINVSLGIYIILKNWRRILNWLCAAVAFLFAVWSFGTTFMRDIRIDVAKAAWFNNIASIGWISFSAFFLLFALQFYTEIAPRKKKRLRFFTIGKIAVTTFPFPFLLLQWNGLFMREYRFELYGWVGVWPETFLTYAFYCYYMGCTIIGLLIIYNIKKRTKSALVRKQCQVIMIAVLIAMTCGSASSILLRHVGIYAVPPLGDMFTLIFAGGLLYATARYQLFHFTPATAAHKILETMSDGVLLIDTNGRIVECNRAIEHMLRYDRIELLEKPFTMLVSEKENTTKLVKELLRKQFILNSKGFLKKKNGEEVPVLCSASIIKDEEEIVGFVMVVHDYTELLNAEMRLLRLVETAKSIIDWVPFGVVICQKNGIIKTANKYACNLFGYTLEEMIGVNCRNLLCAEGETDCPLTEEKREIKNKEMEVVVASGKKIPILKSVLLIPIDGEDTVLETFVDITELKRTKDELIFARDAAEAANRAKSAFLANMSHEIRTPLNAILGFAQLLNETEDDRSKNEKLSIILQSGKHLLRMLNDILDFSKIEAGKIELVETAFSLEELCEEIASIFFLRAKSKGIDFEVKKLNDSIPKVMSDKQRLMQIITNLLDNAIKFTEKGFVKFEYGYQEGIALFKVSDSGIGIPKEKIVTIFQPFDQVDTSITRRYGGTGLGLAIVNQLVELFGGSIDCESEIGKGTTFVIKVPMVQSAEKCFPEEGMRVNSQLLDVPSEKNLNILVVEDNELNRNLFIRLLEMLNMHYDVASNGAHALEKVKNAWENNRPFDVVLLDIQMPVMDGLACIEKIRAHPQYRNLYAVALTAHALPTDEERFKAAGFDDYISKPVDIHVFLQKIRGISKLLREKQ
ncbi:MAG: ATP-binding protein, partial [Spirochaetes bacterium]|nr:ATP-binding protein [Spirochaetota bacterium]